LCDFRAKGPVPDAHRLSPRDRSLYSGEERGGEERESEPKGKGGGAMPHLWKEDSKTFFLRKGSGGERLGLFVEIKEGNPLR